MEHEHRSSVCLSSLVIGALAGVGMALLMGPRVGWAAKHRLAARVRGGVGSARELASRAKETGRQLAEAAAETGRGTVETLARDGGEARPSMREYASVADYRGL